MNKPTSVSSPRLRTSASTPGLWLFNFTEYPAGASLDALGGEYHTPEGTSVWLADVELEPYQALLVKTNK